MIWFNMRISGTTLLPLLLATATGQHIKLPGSAVEPRWATAGRHVSQRADNSSSWPYGPFSTKGRDIVNARGDVITWAGVNWPMSGETMVPEGLEWASVDEILEDVVSVGFNFLRMGYAIEMVDQIYDRGGLDVPLEIAMIQALGYENGTRVTNEIIAKNPSWTRETTRFEVWSDVVSAAAEKGLFVHPDVHTGKAQWCCSHIDGTAWFDDVDFNSTHCKHHSSPVTDPRPSCFGMF